MINSLYLAVILITQPGLPPMAVNDVLVGPTTLERCEIRRDQMVKVARSVVRAGTVRGQCHEFKAWKVET